MPIRREWKPQPLVARVTRRKRAGRLLAPLIAAVLAVPLLVTSAPEAASETRPNILLITMDDMRGGELAWMPRTRELIADKGVRIVGFVSDHPLCCPARAEILTGQYGHNNGVRTNSSTHGGYDSLIRPGNHIGTWLKDSGYRTAMVGKHLNGWELTAVRQRGWTIFNPILKGIYKPYGLTMYNNGSPRFYEDVYTADLIGRFTVRYIDRFSASGAPFFIWVDHVPPHAMFIDGAWRPPLPPPRYRDAYPDSVPPSFSDPAFNEDDVSDKPVWVQNTSKVSRRTVTFWHRRRIRSLRAVDDQVGAAVRALRANGELANTYIIFHSDNGYLLGEHRQWEKNKPYEKAVRVPLLVRGPGLPGGTVRQAMYGTVDIAPTILQLTGATAGRKQDGRSMMPTLRRDTAGYTHHLIQAGRWSGTWWWRGVRSRSHVYVRYDTGFEELYDRIKDPAQLTNVAQDPGYADVRDDLAARLAVLQTCVGETCRSGGVPNP